MTPNFALLAPEFLTLSVVAVLLLALSRGLLRELLFLGINFTFLGGLVLGRTQALATLVFVLLGWLLLELARRSPAWSRWVGIPAYVALFAYMRNYDFLYWVFPDSFLTRLFAAVGLSFLLFKILHLVIEVQGGTLKRISFFRYVNYCLNFTTFVMGPIQRFQDYDSQWTGEATAIPLTLHDHLDAILRVLFGLFRVFVLGAWIQPYMMAWGNDVASSSFLEIVIQVYAFYFFLYCNFGGYCDVMIGIGSLIGVRPPENFNWPFLAPNASDFWQRQHRSLTLWLTDFIFSPTLKSCMRTSLLRRRSALSVSIALMVTMLVSGLWHGTTAGFLLFGLTHGVLLVIYHLWDTWLRKAKGRAWVNTWREQPIVRASGIFLTFNATAFAFVFFQLGAREGLQLFSRLLNP